MSIRKYKILLTIEDSRLFVEFTRRNGYLYAKSITVKCETINLDFTTCKVLILTEKVREIFGVSDCVFLVDYSAMSVVPEAFPDVVISNIEFSRDSVYYSFCNRNIRISPEMKEMFKNLVPNGCSLAKFILDRFFYLNLLF